MLLFGGELDMTPYETEIHNRAIDLALREYKNGIGAIKQLRVNYAVTVEHIGTTTKQDVVDVKG